MADKAAELSLAYLFSRSDTDFAEQVCSSRRDSTAVCFWIHFCCPAQCTTMPCLQGQPCHTLLVWWSELPEITASVCSSWNSGYMWKCRKPHQ